MPIGVPKVPFRSPGEEDASWEDKKERKTNSYLVKNQRKSYYYKLEGTCYEKKSIGIYTLILFFFFFEPYASKGACTVPKGYNLTLINRLYRERLLFLGQEVDSEISNQLIGLMIYLSIEDDTQDLYLFINSPGGWVIPGVALYDTMQFVQPDVHTICMGSAASMGSFILVGGEITKRLAFPHAWRQWGFYLREKRRLCLRHMKYEY
ncbi:putative endopeptidase Clp [Helianthus annuus]|nr:putative endopeptidase Clp [Helianthus annuus]